MFKHALTREVAYNGIPPARRRHLHGRAGAALERSQASQRFEHWELLAYHYSHSADPARAIPYLAAAGDGARDRYANEEAITVYSQAVSLMEETGGDQWPDTYGAICESLGTVMERPSRYGEAIAAYRNGLAGSARRTSDVSPARLVREGRIRGPPVSRSTRPVRSGRAGTRAGTR